MGTANPISAFAAATLYACLLNGCESQATGATNDSGVVSGRLPAHGNTPVTGATKLLVPADHVPSPVFRKAGGRGNCDRCRWRLQDIRRLAGFLEGKVILQVGEDPRTVLILALDTHVLTVDFLAGPLRLSFKAIAAVDGLMAQWKLSVPGVELVGLPADSALVTGYNIYRAAPVLFPPEASKPPRPPRLAYLGNTFYT